MQAKQLFVRTVTQEHNRLYNVFVAILYPCVVTQLLLVVTVPLSLGRHCRLGGACICAATY